MRHAPRMPRVDADLDAHPRSQLRAAFVARINAHAHRDPLHDLDPVAAGVLRRQELKFLGSGRANALDGAVPFPVRIGVYGYRNRLPGQDMRQFGFFRVGIDPDVIRGDEVKGGGGGLKILTRCDRRHVRDDAGERSPDNGVVELALRPSFAS